MNLIDVNTNLAETEMEVIVTEIQGIGERKLTLAIYVGDKSIQRCKVKVKDGTENAIQFKANLSVELMQKIINGNEETFVYFELLEKGFFTTSVFTDEKV
jgi:hypothetical protein